MRIKWNIAHKSFFNMQVFVLITPNWRFLFWRIARHFIIHFFHSFFCLLKYSWFYTVVLQVYSKVFSYIYIYMIVFQIIFHLYRLSQEYSFHSLNASTGFGKFTFFFPPTLCHLQDLSSLTRVELGPSWWKHRVLTAFQNSQGIPSKFTLSSWLYFRVIPGMLVDSSSTHCVSFYNTEE